MLDYILAVVLVVGIVTLVVQNERLERKLAHAINARILGDLPEQVDETIIERYLASQLDYRPLVVTPRPHLHVVTGEARFTDDEDPLSLYDGAGIVVSTH